MRRRKSPPNDPAGQVIPVGPAALTAGVGYRPSIITLCSSHAP
jgi:hypothetical protein